MCDINYIWLFNLLAAVVLITLQQQQHVVGITQQHQQNQEQQLFQQQTSPYDGISSYAAAAAANYLHRSTLPHHMVKRDIKNVKNTDFISYLNDFNMQDEASIPEDIIDQQHLQEIIDKQQQQGVPKKGARPGSGDVIDVNLPYDDSDTDAEVDIILESQRSSERNDDSKSNNSSSSDSEVVEDEDEHEVDKNKNNNVKKTNNKKQLLKEKKTLKTNYKTSNNNRNIDNIDIKNTEQSRQHQQQQNQKQQQQQHQKKIKSENNIDNSNQYMYDVDEQDLEYDNKDDKDDVVEEKFKQDVWDDDDGDDDDDDDDDGSAEYEKFKTMHEQQQKEKEQQRQQQQQQLQHEQQNQQQNYNQQQPEHNEQMSSDKKLNKRKFNNNPDLNEKLVNDDNPDNISSNDDSSYAYDNTNSNSDYEIFHKHQQQQQQQEHEQQQQQPQEVAIGDIEETENPNILKTTITSSHNDKESKDFTQIFIPRKMKRHNGAARLDDAANRYSRLKQQQQEQLQKSQIDNIDNKDYNDADDVENIHNENIAKISSQEENFKKKYYDILKENSTQNYYQPSGASKTQKDFNFYDPPNEKETTIYDDKKQTTFEKEKSLRRNNKHYGHKTHKKKYKDYLRFSQIMMMTTATTTTTPATPTATTPKTTTTIKRKSPKDNQDEVGDLNALRDKHLEKLKIEKLRSMIPQAPIFLLKPKEEKKEEIKDIAKEDTERQEPTAKPFYEGQINYFMETDDDDSERANAVRFITKGERMDTNDWYKKLSPVLRNGNKKSTAQPEERRGFAAVRAGYTPYHHYKQAQPRNHQYHHQQHHQQQQQHHHQAQHHHQQQQHHHYQQHRQTGKHSRHHAYQRKMIPKRISITTTPLPPPSRKHLENGEALRELGHQITDLKDFERYYAKWPHLAKVQSQLHEEELREQQSENYPDYEYDNDDYWEEHDNKEDTLPPYIRKYNRRNKQLLDLLEGTIAPPPKPVPQLRWSGSKLQPGPRDSSVGSMSVRIDDDYLKEKRKRYHQRQRQIHDLFAQQRPSTTTTTQKPPPPYPYITANNGKDVNVDSKSIHNSHTENHLPDEDISISLESNEHDNDYNNPKIVEHNHDNDDDDNDDVSKSVNEQEIWQKEIDIKSANTGNLPINWQMEKLIQSTPAAAAILQQQQGVTTSTQKPAIFKLPSYPSIAGSFMNRPRSRSAQFAPSSGSEYRRVAMPLLNTNLNSNSNNNMNNNFINAGGFVAYNKGATNSKTITGRFSQNLPTEYKPAASAAIQSSTNKPSSFISTSTETASKIASTNHLTSPPSAVTNSFIYHRVVDASPRLVGAGLLAGGRKQRLPFVAITDRRLETSKKSLTDHQKDFEQNHYPLP